MVPPHGVGRQTLFLHKHTVILLKVLRRQALDGHIPQGGREMVVNDFPIPINGRLSPVGLNDHLHPILQPLVQGGGPGGYGLKGVPLRLKIPQALSRLGQGGEGLVGFPSLPSLVYSVIHTDIELVSDVVE